MGNSSDDHCVVLDFFSGSGTTAQAVMHLNAKDSGNRKFMTTQLPEATDIDSDANKMGCKTIGEIGQERIRRAGAKLKERVMTYGARPFMEQRRKKARFFIYNSSDLNELDQYSTSPDLNVTIINTQALASSMKEGGKNKESRIIYSKRDEFASRRPIDARRRDE